MYSRCPTKIVVKSNQSSSTFLFSPCVQNQSRSICEWKQFMNEVLKVKTGRTNLARQFFSLKAILVQFSIYRFPTCQAVGR